jgi:hypothetical protein
MAFCWLNELFLWGLDMNVHFLYYDCILIVQQCIVYAMPS